MKRWMYFLLGLCLMVHAGCNTIAPASPTAAPTPGPTPTQWFPPTSNPPSTPTPSPMDTSRPLATSTPAHDELERALVSRVHWETNAVCEWEVLGQTLQDLYVWVACQSIANDSAVSAPAAIHLKPDGHVERVDVPRDGSLYGPDVQALFPPDVQKRIFDNQFDGSTLWARVAARRAGLPTLTPTPTPKPDSGASGIIDCAAVFPGLPGCLHTESLTDGRLAFVDYRSPFNGRPAVIDLAKGDHAIMGEREAALVGWSPSGQYLITRMGEEAYSVHYANGALTSMYSVDFPLIPSWAPPGALPGALDWLIAPTANGALQAFSFPPGEMRQMLTPGNLGKDGRGIVRWSRDGWLAWSLNTDQLIELGQLTQALFVQPTERWTETRLWRLSDDIRKTYYQLVDWAPGTHLILAAKGMLANSLWSWGVPLSIINGDTGKITDLQAAMRLTPEAYAWNPTRPGLLAFADGGSRYLHDPSRLALLDTTTGKHNHLTGPDMSVSEPAWSPDGRLIAYAAVRASPNASGDGATLERLLNGRAIYIADSQSGKIRKLTQLADDAVDGWPQWSADGRQLLYTRQHDNITDVRVVTLDGSRDELLVTGLARPKCNYGGCGWSRMLAYYPGH